MSKKLVWQILIKYCLLLPSDEVIAKIKSGIQPIFEDHEEPFAAPKPPEAPEQRGEDADDEEGLEEAPGHDEDAPDMPVPFVYVGGEFEADGDYEMVLDAHEDDHVIPLEAYDTVADQEEAARKRLEEEKAVKKTKKKLNKEYRETLLSISQAIDIYNSSNVSRHFCTFVIPDLFRLNYLRFVLLFHLSFFKDTFYFQNSLVFQTIFFVR